MATELSADKSQQIEVALRALNADFCYYLDHRETESLVDMFTEDAVYTHGTRSSQGRAAIKRLFVERNAPGTRTARHFQSGLRIQVLDERKARGQSVCLTFAADTLPPVAPATPTLVADFIDEYQYCSDGRWRICNRHIERIFTASASDRPVGSVD